MVYDNGEIQWLVEFLVAELFLDYHYVLMISECFSFREKIILCYEIIYVFSLKIIILQDNICCLIKL